MRVKFSRTPHYNDEIVLGHKLFFAAVPGCDTISATANTNGFTQLNAIARRLDWDTGRLQASVHRANSEKVVVCIKDFAPRLILVPKLRSDSRMDAFCFMQELFELCKRVDTRAIQFTHFGYISKLPSLGVMEEILQALSMPPKGLEGVDVFFDIDCRRSFYEIFHKMARQVGSKNFVFSQ